MNQALIILKILTKNITIMFIEVVAIPKRKVISCIKKGITYFSINIYLYTTTF